MFTVLATKRSEPFWADAGLPRPFREEPAGLLSAAREFVLAMRGDQRADHFSAALMQVFRRLDDEYGHEAVVGLEAWARRHFVRDAPISPLDEWNRFFLSVARDPRRDLGESLALPVD
ncbi:MAG: hypothetical protein ACREXY_17170, partial [Gammaproteobacteria bacterium]